MTDIPVLQLPHWQRIPGLAHGFFGRAGGVSGAEYASLNLSERSDDDPVAVAENRRRVAGQLGAQGTLVWMQQVHGDSIVMVNSPSQTIPAADGLISAQRGALLAILTADCVPALLVAPRAGVVAAIHAGWRGTLAGIITSAVTRMHQQFGVDPGEVEAALGPSIGGCCYEVERELGERFLRRWGDLPPTAWQPRANRANKDLLDLRGVNAEILRRAGVPAAQIRSIGSCTRCAKTEYFSHRGSNGRTGRQLSYVGWAI